MLLFPVFITAQASPASVVSTLPVVSSPGAIVATSSSSASSDGSAVVAPTGDEFKNYVDSLGGIKGAGTLGIILLVVQGLMLLLRSKAGDLAGQLRLLLVIGLTMVGGIISLRIQGIQWVSVLTNSATLASFQVFLHQIYSQFVEKKA